MADHPYALQGKHSRKGGFSGYLMEDGAQIARVRREPQAMAGAPGSYQIKWYSERAKARYIGFCDCLSCEEVFEALGDHN